MQTPPAPQRRPVDGADAMTELILRWFQWEERLKNFRSIRRGVSEVEAIARDLRGQ